MPVGSHPREVLQHGLARGPGLHGRYVLDLEALVPLGQREERRQLAARQPRQRRPHRARAPKRLRKGGRAGSGVAMPSAELAPTNRIRGAVELIRLPPRPAASSALPGGLAIGGGPAARPPMIK